MKALVRLVAVVLALGALAPAAQASFPGRNGAVGYAFSSVSGDASPLIENAGLATKQLGNQRERTLVHCERLEGVPSSGDCTVTEFRSPSYSADGLRIVFDAGKDLGLIDAGGGPITLLDNLTENPGDPALSPDGRRVVFTGPNDHGGTDLFVYRLGSLFFRTIVQDAGEPAWSSRNRIAYVRDGNIYTSNWKGGKRRFVTSGRSPDWSPGGGRLVFVRPSPNNTFSSSNGRMFTIGARGRGLQPVFPRVTDAIEPVWSPDGRWLAYSVFESGIFAKRLGSRRPAEQVAISQPGGEGGSVSSFDATWRPRPR
jgi:Tol biopolymer transport system component